MDSDREEHGSDARDDTRWFQIGEETECSHDPLVNIGTDAGNNSYFQCQDCVSVLIKENTDYNPEMAHESAAKSDPHLDSRSNNPFLGSLQRDGNGRASGRPNRSANGRASGSPDPDARYAHERIARRIRARIIQFFRRD